MISKFLKPLNVILTRNVKTVDRRSTRKLFGMIPPSQYDSPLSKKFNPAYALRVYWELIPLFSCVFASLSILTCSILWAIKNKVDVVYSTRNRRNISRTMNLRQPTVHKIITINQRYDPWPEMQDVLDKMADAEKRNLLRLQACSQT